MKSSQVVKLRVEEKRDDKGEFTRWERRGEQVPAQWKLNKVSGGAVLVKLFVIM